jgi:hypothetical protein
VLMDRSIDTPFAFLSRNRRPLALLLGILHRREWCDSHALRPALCECASAWLIARSCVAGLLHACHCTAVEPASVELSARAWQRR